MQNELDALGLPQEIRIHGVNGIGSESNNAAACNGKDIPWLQETVDEPVWTDWEVNYRDVVILDEGNLVVGTYNLTANDLNLQDKYDELKSMLIGFSGGE